MESLKQKALFRLQSMEHWLRLDLTYLAKGGWWTSLSFVAGTLASLVSMVAFGNLLPREAYGTYNYLLALGASLSFLTLSGTGIGVLRAVSRGHENVVPEALKFQLKYNLIAVTTILVAGLYYGIKGNWLFASALIMLSVAYPVAEAFHIYVQVLTAQKRFDLLTKITSATALAGAVATVATLYFTRNILALIAVYTGMALLPNLISYYLTVGRIEKTEPEPEQVNEMKRTAFHITGAGIVGIVAAYIDKIILFQVAGPAVLAVYGFAIAGPERLKSLIKGWTTVTLPRLARKSLGSIRETLYWHLTLALVVGALATLCYWFVAPLLFRIFLPRYLDAVFYSQIQSLSLIVVPATIYLGSIFASQNMLRATYISSVGNQVFRIFLFLLFGWRWQIWGLIAASIIFNFASAACNLIVWELEYRRLKLKNE